MPIIDNLKLKANKCLFFSCINRHSTLLFFSLTNMILVFFTVYFILLVRCFLAVLSAPGIVFLQYQNSSRNRRRSFFISALYPPCLWALALLISLPSSLCGPVLCSHGLQFCISSACRFRRSGVQPLGFIAFILQ